MGLMGLKELDPSGNSFFSTVIKAWLTFIKRAQSQNAINMDTLSIFTR